MNMNFMIKLLKNTERSLPILKEFNKIFQKKLTPVKLTGVSILICKRRVVLFGLNDGELLI
jgi:hypothetical protein